MCILKFCAFESKIETPLTPVLTPGTSIRENIRVAQITPTSCDKAAHLPNWAPWSRNQPKQFLTKSEFSDYIWVFWVNGIKQWSIICKKILGKWAALSHDVGVIRDTLLYEYYPRSWKFHLFPPFLLVNSANSAYSAFSANSAFSSNSTFSANSAFLTGIAENTGIFSGKGGK